MQHTLDFLLRHGYAVVFLTVLAEQAGLPIPALPCLLAMGALVGMGTYSPWIAVLLAVLGCLLSDGLWYELGRRQGQAILGVMCKLSLEPDYCISRTKNVFGRYGDQGLLFAKFVPGLSTIAPPMAGMTRMHRGKFFLLDGIGSAVWAGLYLLLGALFRTQLQYIADTIVRLGSLLGTVLVLALVLFGIWEIWQRRRFLRELRQARVTPEEVKQWLDDGDPIVIVDLRHGFDIGMNPEKLPGAIRMTSEELEERHSEIPRDREVVLYCS